MEIAVEAAGVSKSYSGKEVLYGVSMTVGRGEAVGVVGPNGCGKTTLLRILAGLEKPDSGEVRVLGRVGMVFQEDLLLPWKSLADNIGLGLTFRRAPSEEVRRIVHALAEDLGISQYLGLYPHQVSGGTARKAALARALATDPDVLLLDEPYAGLDADSRASLNLSLSSLARGGTTMLLVSHQLDELLWLVDRMYVLTPPPARVRAEVRLRGMDWDERKRAILEVI